MKKIIFIGSILVLVLVAAVLLYYFLFRQAGESVQPVAESAEVDAEQLSFIDVDTECYGLGISGNYLYMGLNNKIAAIDISRPDDLELAFEYSSPEWTEDKGWAINLMIEDDLVFACPNHRLEILQIGPQKNLSSLAWLPLEGFDLDMAKVGDALFIKGSYMGPEQQELARLFAVDVANSRDPELLWSMDIDESIYTIAADSQYIYLAGSGILKTVEVKKDSPEVIDDIAIEGWINHLQIDQDLLYAAGSQGIYIYSLNPEPVLQQTGNLNGYMQKIKVEPQFIWGILQTKQSSDLVAVNRDSLNIAFRDPVEGFARELFLGQQNLFAVSSEALIQCQNWPVAEHVPSRLFSYRIDYQ